MRLLAALFLFFSLQTFAESGPGNGTDYVKILFAESQYTLLSTISSIGDAGINNLEIDSTIKAWLLANVDNTSRWQLIKYYLRTMDLQYQQEPCSDFSKKPASICFFNEAGKNPYVMISLQENKMTTKTEAMAMLIHEAGHFTKETDHLFLDHVGVALVAALQAPTLLMADAENTDTVAAVFLEKDQCDAGASNQAQLLKKQVLMDLTIQCQRKQLSCDLQKTQFVFQGIANSKPGVGFDMTVTCKVRAVLTLR